MFKPKNLSERLSHRVKITQGHLKKVAEMIDSGSYCIDILHQSNAIQKSLKEIDNLILENHLNTCVSDSIKKGNKKEAVREVMEVFKRKNDE